MQALTWFPHHLYRDGDWFAAADAATTAVTNPATGAVLGQVAAATPADIRLAIDAAARALPAWRATPAAKRAEYLLAIHATLLANRERLARLLTAENGKPLAQARGEVDYAASFYRWFAGEARRLANRTVPHPDPTVESWVEQVPLGVVGAITPWNFPLSQGAKKLSAALAAGCTVVLKPAPDTPLIGLAMGWIAQQAGLPPGVITILTGPAEAIGEAFIADARVRCISVTGSVRTGALLAGQAGAKLKHVRLELGGNAPFLVLPDADLDFAAEQLVSLKLLTNGQTCVTANRVFLHADIAQAFEVRLVERLQQVVIGDPLAEATTLGPLINSAGLAKVARLVDDALARGAERLLGDPACLPAACRHGTFYPMTLLTRVTNTMPIAQEEIFGPVLACQTYTDEADLLARANATAYGLAGYVYGHDTDRVTRLARGLDVGIVGINDMRPLRAEVPFGGTKQSGLGREGGEEGLHDFLEAKTYSHRVG